jgi:hypothetical protein
MIAAPASARRALANELPRVIDQLVGILGRNAVGGILQRGAARPCIFAIFLAEPVIEAGRGVADQLGDIGQRLAGTLQSLTDQLARLVGRLAGQFVGAALELFDRLVAGCWFAHDQGLLISCADAPATTRRCLREVLWDRPSSVSSFPLNPAHPLIVPASLRAIHKLHPLPRAV